MMITCKKCGSEKIAKSGIVAGKQRFRCKECACNFRFGDNRTNEKIAAKKALCILWYSLDKGSFRLLGKLLQTKHTLIYRWINDFGKNLPEPQTSNGLRQLKFDELWHFIGLKKENHESLKQLILTHEKRLSESTANAILQRIDGYTIK